MGLVEDLVVKMWSFVLINIVSRGTIGYLLLILVINVFSVQVIGKFFVVFCHERLLMFFSIDSILFNIFMLCLLFFVFALNHLSASALYRALATAPIMFSSPTQ